MANRDNSHLQTPAVRRKRLAGIRRAIARRRKAARAAALIPLDAIPGERRPAIAYAVNGGGKVHRAARFEARLELARDVTTLLRTILGAAR